MNKKIEDLHHTNKKIDRFYFNQDSSKNETNIIEIHNQLYDKLKHQEQEKKEKELINKLIADEIETQVNENVNNLVKKLFE